MIKAAAAMDVIDEFFHVDGYIGFVVVVVVAVVAVVAVAVAVVVVAAAVVVVVIIIHYEVHFYFLPFDAFDFLLPLLSTFVLFDLVHLLSFHDSMIVILVFV